MTLDPDPALPDVARAGLELAAPVVHAMAQASPAWLVIALAFHTVSLLARAAIWRRLLTAALPDQRVRFTDALGPYLLSIAAGVFAPLRGGDAVRLAAARRTLPEASTIRVGATLAAEAISGLIVVPLLALVALALGVLPVSHTVIALASLGCVVFAVAVWAAARALSRRADRSGRAGRVLAEIAAGVAVVGSPRRFARTVGPLTALDWLLRLATIVALLAAFRVALFPAAAPAVAAVDSLTTMIPFLPNGAGVQQAAVVGALHGHASTGTIVGFSVGTQLLIGAANLLGGALALLMLVPRVQVRRAAAAPVARALSA
jgi:uncharacterized membrane protein YbhN (UPF0104 family)